MDEEYKFDEIYLAKVENENSYILIHSVIDNKILLRKFPQKVLKEINYDKLCGYLEGVSLGKTDKTFHLYNGISNLMVHCLLPDNKYSFLNRKELEKLLSDSGLNEYKDKVKTAVWSTVG
jgi:hypothetical protein